MVNVVVSLSALIVELTYCLDRRVGLVFIKTVLGSDLGCIMKVYLVLIINIVKSSKVEGWSSKTFL